MKSLATLEKMYSPQGWVTEMHIVKIPVMRHAQVNPDGVPALRGGREQELSSLTKRLSAIGNH